jgi:hypothetical protein
MSSNKLTVYTGGGLSTNTDQLDKQLAKQARRRVDEDLIRSGMAAQASANLQDLHDDQRSLMVRSAYAAQMTIESFPEGRMRPHVEAMLLGQWISTGQLMEDIKTSYSRAASDAIDMAFQYDDRSGWQRLMGRK